MGCTASRPNALPTGNHHHYNSQNNPSHSYSLASATNSTIASSNSPRTISTTKSLSLQTQAPLVHHPPSRKGDTHHLVSLTSTTYGSLLLIDRFNGQDSPDQIMPTTTAANPVEPSSLSPDSVINTWELMDGLDDDDDGVVVDDDINFHKADACGSVKVSPSTTKPLWKHLSEESLLSKMDPNVASSYRRALSSRQLVYNNNNHHHHQHRPTKESNNKIVIYFTSLRGIRRTYEDCCSVRMIFKSYRVGVDERDISMDSSYRKELQDLLGVEGKAITLPQVFIRGKHIGGAEEIKQLNETGDLVMLLKGFPVVNAVSVCESCGDARFVPCSNCCGSRKVFDEEDGQLRRCTNCNENGLIRCPACSCC
ncbi:hypothetical protein WN944_023999 [Citrus x changshan-huyou]|uniref:Glutaredoxin domain-containing protein n=1 Tax=Citrus x changshan-huyou TaxID=2935761 RepID=A0AAP0LM60_9ROSI